jgi:bifunctional N-acetylglucosamine-1-phosphate-uridyltransferase/glucosamine-1-phosphate-acetyltransferase GlmU-like protein
MFAGETRYVYYNVAVFAKTQPFSIRLAEQANLLVEDEVRRSGRSRSVVVEELAEEAAKTRLHPGVAFRGRPRRAWVIGSGLDVWEIIELLGSYRDDVVALASDHPLITDRHLRTARAYAAQFAAEIDAQLAENRRPVSELAELYPFLQRPGR